MHWLEQDLIWKECDRVLKPGGVIAIWGYTLPFVSGNDLQSQDILDYHNWLWNNGFWDDKRKLLDDKYSHLNLPYKNHKEFVIHIIVILLFIFIFTEWILLCTKKLR